MKIKRKTLTAFVLVLVSAACGELESEAGVAEAETSVAASASCPEHYDTVVYGPQGNPNIFWAGEFSTYGTCREHIVSNTLNKTMRYDAAAEFPQWTGEFTSFLDFQTAVQNCQDSQLNLEVRRPNGSLIIGKQVSATADSRLLPGAGGLIFVIDDCDAHIGTNGIYFEVTDQSRSTIVTTSPPGTIRRLNPSWGTTVARWVN